MADRKLFEALYQSVARDLQKMKAELMKEVANTSSQVNSLCESVKTNKPEEEVTRELRYMQKQIQSLYEGVEGVVDAVVDLVAKNVTVTGNASLEALRAAITEAGYDVME